MIYVGVWGGYASRRRQGNLGKVVGRNSRKISKRGGGAMKKKTEK